jgi:hypothetical protein
MEEFMKKLFLTLCLIFTTKLYLIIFTLISIIVVSCYNVNEPCVYAEDFFPLRVGDKFVYEYSFEESFSGFAHIPIEASITGTIDINEKTYYVIKNCFAMLDFYDSIAYVRNEGNSVYFFNGVKDTLFYKFNSSLNSEYPVSFLPVPNGGNDPATIKKISFGSNHITFLIRLTPGSLFENYKWYITFERGKGITKGVSEHGNNGYIHSRVVYNLIKIYR